MAIRKVVVSARKSDMGNILNPQRRAIEALRHKAQPPPPSMKDTPLFLTDGTRLYLWGVSDGVGSCADVKGMDVLGVGTTPFTGNSARTVLNRASEEYAYVVLCRAVTDAERKGWGQFAVRCVELLRYVGTKEGAIEFELTGDAEVYVNL